MVDIETQLEHCYKMIDKYENSNDTTHKHILLPSYLARAEGLQKLIFDTHKQNDYEQY